MAGKVPLNKHAIELYRRWWELADRTTFVDVFREPHAQTEDARKSWEVLTDNLRAPHDAGLG